MSTPKRLIVGRALRSDRMDETLLPKRIALPVFCSDPLSSVAYATQEILLVLAIGGAALLHLAWWAAAAVALLLTVVVLSYRQTCHAYPNGGGAYAVSRENLGQSASLVAASALLVDYVLTVAVSVVAGVDNVVSAVPALATHAVALSIAGVVVLVLANLRGVKESGTAFAIPTYGFVASILLLLAVAVGRAVFGHPVVAASASLPLHAQHTVAGAAVLLLLLRAFSSGCTALTGVEAISNGVPAFRPPKSRNAAATLALMGALAVTMFGGITALALTSHVHYAPDPAQLGLPASATQQTVIAQLGAATFGSSSMLFYLTQAFTAAVLVLAANTAFNGFPVLASILGRDGFLPRQFDRRGDRLVFSNGILVLAVLAVALIVAFDADTSRLIQLYIVGVFVSFTLSQLGMVRHWTSLLRETHDGGQRARMRRSRIINAVGATFTAVVLCVVLVTKFVHGAWIVTIAMPLLVWMMLGIRRHYRRVAEQLRPRPGGFPLPARVHVIVPVARIHTAALRALAYARATRPATLVAITAEVDPAETRALLDEWDDREIPVPLVVLEAPYRDITRALMAYILERKSHIGPRDVLSVFIPEYVVGHWWEQLLHNQSALRLKTRLLFTPGVMVTSVPAHLDIELEPSTQQPPRHPPAVPELVSGRHERR